MVILPPPLPRNGPRSELPRHNFPGRMVVTRVHMELVLPHLLEEVLIKDKAHPRQDNCTSIADDVTVPSHEFTKDQ